MTPFGLERRFGAIRESFQIFSKVCNQVKEMKFSQELERFQKKKQVLIRNDELNYIKPMRRNRVRPKFFQEIFRILLLE